MSSLDTPGGARRRKLLHFVAASALTGVAARAQAHRELRVLLAAETAQHAAVVESLRARWPAMSTHGDPAGAVQTLSAPLAYAAIGPRALQQALQVEFDAPLIAVLVSRQAYERFIEQAARPRRGVTAVFAEASPAQQMRTIAAVMRRTVTVAALASPSATVVAPALEAAAKSVGLSAVVQAYDPAIGMSRNLLRLAGADAVLIYPDSGLFTPASLRELLESTYRRRQPVFGFSEALVQAGTLASAHASADDLAAHVVELLSALNSGREARLPAPEYPRYWRVAVNDSVARSLDIVIDGAARSLGDRP